MRLTTKRNGKNVIPLLMAVCGINLPYWRIDKADDLHSYLSGDAVDKLAAYEDAEEQGQLVPAVRCRECKHWHRCISTDDRSVEYFNFSHCEKGHNGYPEFFCAEGARMEES